MTKKEKTTNKDEKESRIEEHVGYFSGVGHPHPVAESVQEMRSLMLSLGFDEVQTSSFLPYGEVRSLTGELYPVFKDAVYHLAWIHLDPVPPTPENESGLKERFPELDTAELWNILDTIDEDTSGEDLLDSLVKELGIDVQEALEVMNKIPGLRSGSIEPSNITMKAFMPISWMSTLEATYDPEKMPVRLFTISNVFRREPKLDPKHIRTYHVLSIAVIDNDADLNKGRTILKRIFDTLEVEGVKMKKKSYPFPYFEKGTETEIFGDGLEIGTCGILSQGKLREKGMDTNVFIADVGIERLLMYRHGYRDIRRLFFPQFHAAWDLTDEDISSSIKYIHRPSTDFGKEIATAVHKAYKEISSEEKRSKHLAWSGRMVESDYGRFLIPEEKVPELKIEGRKAELYIKEAQKDMGLFGPAAFNEIWIKDGNIIGAPPEMSEKMEGQGAVKTNKTFVKAFSRFAAWKVEKALERGHTGKKFEVIRDLEGINLKLTGKALHYILSHKKKVDIQGPVYLKFYFKVKDDRE